MTFNTLRTQTFQDFQWLPRLSVPGQQSDLSYQMNKALEEAKGEIIVFLQDYIQIPEDALEHIAALYETTDDAYTFPMIKAEKEDWRFFREAHGFIEPQEWEIDFGAARKEDIVKAGGFFEKYDEGFGWENVDLACRMHKEGVKFRVDPELVAWGIDHDAIMTHPYRCNPNQSLWETRKGVIDMLYEDQDLVAPQEPERDC